MSGAPVLMKIYGHQDFYLLDEEPDTSIFITVHHETYTDFVNIYAKIDSENNSGTLSANSRKHNPMGQGDLLHRVFYQTHLPALAANSGSAAYYCQEAGFAQFKEVSLKMGNGSIQKLTPRIMNLLYHQRMPQSCDPIDVDIMRYQKEAQLIQVAKGDSYMLVELPFYFTYRENIHKAFPLSTFHQTNVAIEVTHAPLLDWTVDLGSTTTVPKNAGTNSPLAMSDLKSTVFGSFYILDDFERFMFYQSYYARQILQYQEETTTIQSSLTAGQVVQMTPTFNHSVRALVLGRTLNSSHDGSTYSRNGVGIKNHFDYSATHGGESLYSITLDFNKQEFTDKTLPPRLLRSVRWRECYGKTQKNMLYLVSFQNDLTTDKLIHTVNFSRIQKFTVTVNINEAGAGELFMIAENVMILVGHGGQGGVPWS